MFTATPRQGCQQKSERGALLTAAALIPAGNIYVEYCDRCNAEYVRNFYVLDDASEDLLEQGGPLPAGTHIEKCATCQLNHFTGRHCSKAGSLLAVPLLLLYLNCDETVFTLA